MFGQFLILDERLFRQINLEWANPVFDWVMAAVSSPTLFMPLLVLAVLWLLWRGGARGRAFCVVVFLNLAIGDGFINQSLRKVIQRPRPHEYIAGARRVEWQDFSPRVKIATPSKKPGGRSMPSGHMLNNVSIGAAAICFFPRLFWPLAGWMLLMGYARVYTGAHHPLDVLVSVWIGLIYSAIFVVVCEMGWKYAVMKWPSSMRDQPRSLVAGDDGAAKNCGGADSCADAPMC